MAIFHTHIPSLPNSLTKAEIHNCIILMRAGDMKSRQRLIEGNLKLVLYFINTKFQYLPLDSEELFQVGCLGLIKGIDTYDPDRNIEFVTYVSKCIINEILMLARKNGTTPFTDSLDRQINTSSDDTSDNRLMDTISLDDDLEEDYAEKEEVFILREIIKSLPVNCRLMIEMYYGLNGQERHTQRELADYFGMSQCHISRTLNKIYNLIEKEMYITNVNVLYKGASANIVKR